MTRAGGDRSTYLLRGAMSRRRAIAGIACFTATTCTMRPAAAAKLSVTAVGHEDASAAPVLYAIKAQLFDDQGLNVTLSYLKSDRQIVEALAAKTAEVASVGTLAAARAIAKGVQLSFIAGGELNTASAPISQVVTAPDSPLRTARDFNGKTVAVPQIQGIDHLAFSAWIDKNGGDLNSLKFVAVLPGEIPKALTDKRVDAAVRDLRIPIAPNTPSMRLRVTADPNGAVKQVFLATGWVATASFAQNNPAAPDRFYTAITKANSYLNDHPAELRATMREYMTVPEQLPRFTSNEKGKAVIVPVLDAAVKYHFLERQIDNFWGHSFC